MAGALTETSATKLGSESETTRVHRAGSQGISAGASPAWSRVP